MEESWIRWVIIGLAGTFLIHRIYKMLTRRRTSHACHVIIHACHVMIHACHVMIHACHVMIHHGCHAMPPTCR
eukprot:1353194-Amorphochlora_amoeboformis.AAC.1